MAFYEKQKRKQVTSGYKIKMSGLHHGLLGSTEHKVLNRVMSANKRAIGNLVLQAGNKKGARGYYKQALFIDPSFKSIAKYVLSYLPTKTIRA